MPRLIDADALINDVIERYCKDCERRKGIKNGKQIFIYDIGEAPCRACAVDDMKDELENAPTEPQYLDLENTTIMGYRLRDLCLLSEALRESHIDKIDLIRFVNNVESAYNYATGEFTKSIKRSLEKSFEGLWDVDEEGDDVKTD